MRLHYGWSCQVKVPTTCAHFSARLSLPSASGPWQDSRGDRGTLVLGAGAVVDYASAIGVSPSPLTVLNFIGPTATVTVTGPAQRVHVTASKALASHAGGGGLTLYVCARSTQPANTF